MDNKVENSVSLHIANIDLKVEKAYKAPHVHALRYPYEHGGALIDDDIIILDIHVNVGNEAAKYGYALNRDGSANICAINEWLTQHKTPKRNLWIKSTAPWMYFFTDEATIDSFRVLAYRRKTTSTDLVSRLDHAYSQVLFSGIDASGSEARFFYNVIRGVELGAIDQKKLGDILKSVSEPTLNKLKASAGTKRISVKTLYNSIIENNN